MAKIRCDEQLPIGRAHTLTTLSARRAPVSFVAPSQSSIGDESARRFVITDLDDRGGSFVVATSILNPGRSLRF